MNSRMDESRYGSTPRWKILLLGLPPAIFMTGLGVYWTLLSWGVIGGAAESRTFGAIGPIIAGLGVALGYVCLRPRREA